MEEVTFACLVPIDPGDAALWLVYLQAHGCEVILARLSDDTPYYQVTLPSGSVKRRIGGELEPTYRCTLPDGATLIAHLPRMRKHNLALVGLTEDDWNAWKAKNAIQE